MTEKFQTKKSLGQHFLNNEAVPKWLADAGEVGEGDQVVEIGPGTGALTRELLNRGADVLALETDRRAIEVLEKTFAREAAAGQLKIRETDVRELDLDRLGLTDHSFKVVANIPYYLTGHLFRMFLESPIQPSQLVFLVQKEVARRAAASRARGEKESLLSLSIKAFGEPMYVHTVGKGHFSPPPQVDSAIILVRNIGRQNFTEIDPQSFFEILHLGFGQKRKQLMGNLSRRFGRESVERCFAKIGLKADVRAEDLSIEAWLKLAAALIRTA